MLFKKLYIFILLIFISFHSKAQFANESVLAKEKWVKMGVTQTGVYKLDRNWLQEAGFDVNNLNPQFLQVYGNGGKALPQANADSRPDDLQENTIFIFGESDGNFGENDYIIFYAQGPQIWEYNTTSQKFDCIRNLYSDTSYYFITIDENLGKRISNVPTVSGASQTINAFDEHLIYEKDEINLLQSGREWYGENFRFATSQSFEFNTEGITGGNILLTPFVMAGAASNTNFQVALNGQNIGIIDVNAVLQGTYEYRGRDAQATFISNANALIANTLSVDLTYNSGGNANFEAYLNYLELQFPKVLKLYENQTSFRSIQSLNNSVTRFLVAEVPSNLQIWDVSDIFNIKNQNISIQNNTATFSTNTTNLKEFVAFNPDNLSSPESFRNIENQNLHGLSPVNLLIITPVEFRSEAERLANFHQNQDGLSVAIVNIEQVFNEFSSGKVDISAVRDFARMLYLRDNNTFRYLLLFGDASYDFKNRLENNNNWIPIYESYESLHPIYSYSSDDYLGFLEENEGEWQETINSTSGDHSLDIGIGRLPVNSLEEAKVVVDKIIHYSTSDATLGAWRQKICFVADDGDVNIHQRDAERLSNFLDLTGTYNIEKLYLDAFPQNSSPDGERSPKIVQQINRNVEEKGAFILNYTGHGGEVGWAEEDLLNLEQINQWDNYDKLSFMVTATCEFGRYDNPDLASGAEQALLSSKGGAIALITTTRPVFSNTNFLVNNSLYQVIFTEINGEMPRLGDVQRQTKNLSLAGSVNRNFALLGDPALRLAYPKNQIVLTKINEQNITTTDTLNALQHIKIEAEVRDAQGNILSNYEGIAEVSVFDNERTLQTLGTQSSPMEYTLQNSVLFRGRATVKDGKFTVEFIIPKDIDYNFKNGKMSFYITPNEGVQDAGGAYTDVIIGGTVSNIPLDDTPPEIRLFMEDTSFVSGDLVGSDTELLALLYDENGLNISQSSLGHEMTAILDEDTNNPIILNDYYIANIDDFKNGQIVYPFSELSEGWHTLSLKVWDTHNNSDDKKIEFLVSNSAALAFREVIAYPNPFSEKTTFIIDHNRVDEDLLLNIEIFNQQGKKVRDLNYSLPTSNSRNDISWDGKDNSGNLVSAGIYLFKLKLRSNKDGTASYYSSRIVVIR